LVLVVDEKGLEEEKSEKKKEEEAGADANPRAGEVGAAANEESGAAGAKAGAPPNVNIPIPPCIFSATLDMPATCTARVRPPARLGRTPWPALPTAAARANAVR
jgi:hypothetical protein